MVSKQELMLVLSYPRDDITRAKLILQEILQAGVIELINVEESRIRIGNFGVLGKGHSSVVVLGRHRDGNLVAVKIRRLDSKRDSLELECNIMMKAYPIAPKVYYCSRDIIVMEFIRGRSLGDIVNSIESCNDAVKLILNVLRAIYELDLKGIDHKELSTPKKHIIIDDRGNVRVIDFESASITDKARNICRVASWLLIRKKLITNLCSVDLSNEVIKILKRYKQDISVFSKLIELISRLCTT